MRALITRANFGRSIELTCQHLRWDGPVVTNCWPPGIDAAVTIQFLAVRLGSNGPW